MENYLIVLFILVSLFIFIIIALETNHKISFSLNNLADKGVWGLNILGVILLITASLMPFLVKNYYDSRIENYSNLTDLGAVGDFIGGTTVAFLTAASVVLLLATIIMQRKEIKISQRSIEELVKQTEATVKQAEEARKETQITNDTMKKQQFETTFFNMINLHHIILSEIKIGDTIGRDAIKEFYKIIKEKYDNEIYEEYSEEIKIKAFKGDIHKFDELIKEWFLNLQLNYFIYEFENQFHPTYLEDDTEDFTELEIFHKSLEEGTNILWNKEKEKNIKYFNNNISGNQNEYNAILSRSDFDLRNLLKNNVSHEYIVEFNYNFNLNPLKRLKKEAYEKSYREKENQIGHYYRNLYRIIKLIQNEVFDINEEVDELEKRKYRGILRAQLSSYELLMIFYNVVYSEKGQKFKEILTNTNFFDDHLIIEDFIWKNDAEVLLSLDTTKK